MGNAYSLCMVEENDRQDIPGYVPIKEAAKILGISANRVYAYVEEGRLPSAKAAHVIMIPLEAVKTFKPQLSGRPRTSIPIWRISPEGNTLIMTIISVQVRDGQYVQLVKKFENIRRDKSHIFTGSITRYIMESEVHTGRINIILIWRSTMMPDEASREQELEAFRHILADEVDWDTAQYDTGKVMMHT